MSFFSTKKFAAPASILLLSLGMMSGAPSRAQTSCVEGSAPPDDGCLKGAEKYELIIYEMGLCTSDPLILSSGNRVFNKSGASCVASFASDNGKIANIAGSQTVDLGQGSKPPSNTYSHAYIVLSKNITIKGTHIIEGITHYSIEYVNEDGTIGFSSTNSSSYEEFIESVDDVSSSESWGAYMPAENHPDGGSVTALLIGTGYSVDDNGANAASSKSAVEKLIGVFTPSEGGVTIDENDRGLNVTLDSSNGMSVWQEGSPSAGLGFGSAPFRPSFTVIK
ncbi:hypothetical protein SynPROS91_00750 [Synechococcus sp. PROS-9-1]|uniref:hypothetical protein n=1 Tax=Synechococcus sp. PROS-9-1 TaxID=1968775 RepID=UPI001647903F|nr:hypothetical protein [Synechococcus sp. PROS-9-1]QNJ31146.1 hypothetical protein SynPROS91_00750 [Synechococcus sp. PROS-9-1]